MDTTRIDAVPSTKKFNSTDTPCLSADRLEALAEGDTLSDEGMEHLKHVEACDVCRSDYEDRKRFAKLRRGFNPEEPNLAPPNIPGHAFVRKIGGGGQGNVYHYFHETLRQDRAVKVMIGSKLDERARRSLRAEARRMAALRPHANRVQVFDLIEVEDSPAILMSLASGGRLSDYAPMDLPIAAKYILDACEGLLDMHEPPGGGEPILHRDIKGQNIFLDGVHDVAILGDYGLTSTRSGCAGLSGTVGFMAPEIRWDQYSGKSDVYALAMTLHQLLTKRLPFTTESVYAYLRDASLGLPDPAPTLEGFEPGVVELIRMGLEPDPDRRPDLRRFMTLLKIIHIREVAESLHRLAARPAATELKVTIVQLEPRKAAGPRLQCSSRDSSTWKSPPECLVRPGDELEVTVTADRAGHFTVLNFDSAGSINVLVPGPFAASGARKSGEPLRVRIPITPSPAGDHLAAIWTSEPDDVAPEIWRERILEGRLSGSHKGMPYAVSLDQTPVEPWAVAVVALPQ